MMEVVRPRRILITGSRDWTDRTTLAREIVRYVSEHAVMGVDSQGLPVDYITTDWVIVHGACKEGADYWADEFAVVNLIEQEPHPADWKRYGRRAGMVRNAEMVQEGADVCLAFINPCTKINCWRPRPHGSHGSTHCADLAEANGIEVRRFTP